MVGKPLLFLFVCCVVLFLNTCYAFDYPGGHVLEKLHDLPHYNVNFEKTNNTFDPEDVDYDQSIGMFALPGIILAIATIIVMIVTCCLFCGTCCMSCFCSGSYIERGKAFIVLILILVGLIILAGIVSILTFVVSINVHLTIKSSLDPVQDLAEKVGTGVDIVEQLLNTSDTALDHLQELNQTRQHLFDLVSIIDQEVQAYADFLNNAPIPNLSSELTTLMNHAQNNSILLIDYPDYVTPFLTTLTSVNQTLTNKLPFPLKMEEQFLELNSSVVLSAFINVTETYTYIQVITFLILNDWSNINEVLLAFEVQKIKSNSILLPEEKTLLDDITVSNQSFTPSILNLTNEISQLYVSQNNSIDSIKSLENLINQLIAYNDTNPLPHSLSTDLIRINKTLYTTSILLPTSLLNDLSANLNILQNNKTDLENQLQKISSTLSDALNQLTIPPNVQQAIENYKIKAAEVKNISKNYISLFDKINDYLPKIKDDVSNADLVRVIIMSISLIYYLILLLSTIYILYKRPRAIFCVLISILIGLIFTSFEIIIFLPPQVFAADFCVDSDNYIHQKIESSDNDLLKYADYYLFCNSSDEIGQNPFTKYLDQGLDALNDAENEMKTLQNYTSLVPSAQPYVTDLNGDIADGKTGIIKLFNLSNCTNVTPDYLELKDNVCHDLLDSAFWYWSLRVVLVVILLPACFLAVFGGCCVAVENPLVEYRPKRLRPINDRWDEENASLLTNPKSNGL